jgi:hypothetical protein
MPLALGSFLLSYSTWECLSSSDMGSVGTILAWAVLPLIWVYSLAMLISCKNTEELVRGDNMGKFICRFCQTNRIHATYCGPFYLSCVLWGVFLHKTGNIFAGQVFCFLGGIPFLCWTFMFCTGFKRNWAYVLLCLAGFMPGFVGLIFFPISIAEIKTDDARVITISWWLFPIYSLGSLFTSFRLYEEDVD